MFTLRPYQSVLPIAVLCILGMTIILLDLFVYKSIDPAYGFLVGQPYVPQDAEYPQKKRWMLRVAGATYDGGTEPVETTYEIWKRCKQGDIVLVNRKQSLIFGRIMLGQAIKRSGFD